MPGRAGLKRGLARPPISGENGDETEFQFAGGASGMCGLSIPRLFQGLNVLWERTSAARPTTSFSRPSQGESAFRKKSQLRRAKLARDEIDSALAANLVMKADPSRAERLNLW